MEPLWKWCKLAKFIPIKTKPQWYRYDDPTWDPTEGELWDRTESTDVEDEDEDYPPEFDDGKPDEDHEVQDDSCKATSEQDDEAAAMSGTKRDLGTEFADGESTPAL
ncbi:hypothetical protein DAEQUDRAFT_725347 [Daedalea quercina L-15889]|uniref:Uncharacterized protein n=1 Tax=Daedalea quercina L-15889 TaxID=1314783 RepID=A0A165R8J6_9APHY|nr:hypothetical protein DAEQUDRAFT_725347 [Daedalea quercina L-15889]